MSYPIGNGPPPPPGNDATPEERLEYQNQVQEYWFAINNMQNTQNQAAMSKSNMQKAEHDAIMEMVRNIK